MSAKPARKPEVLPAPKRSGSEKRQRGVPVSVRFSPTERAALDAKARAAGLSIGSYLRAAGLGDAGPRARRAPTVNAELLAHALAGLNKAGSNLNQVAHVLNAGRAAGARASTEAVAELLAVVMQIKDALGRTERP